MFTAYKVWLWRILGEANKGGQIKGSPTPHAWELLQVWQMLRTTKGPITETEEAQEGQSNRRLKTRHPKVRTEEYSNVQKIIKVRFDRKK